MHRPSTLKNKYSCIFFYKNIAATVLKFYMKHDLPPRSQNYIISNGPGEKVDFDGFAIFSNGGHLGFLT